MSTATVHKMSTPASELDKLDRYKAEVEAEWKKLGEAVLAQQQAGVHAKMHRLELGYALIRLHREVARRGGNGEIPMPASTGGRPRAAWWIWFEEWQPPGQPGSISRDEATRAMKIAGDPDPEAADEALRALRAAAKRKSRAKLSRVTDDPVTQESPAQEKGRQNDTEIDPKTLSMTAQEKLDAAIRQEKRRLEAEFDERVGVEAKKLVDETLLPHWQERVKALELQWHMIGDALFSRRPLITKQQHRLILSCLHPDSRGSTTPERLHEAFQVFNNEKIEIALCGPESDRLSRRPRPPSWEEMMARKEARTAKNRERGKRAAATRAARKADANHTGDRTP